MTETRSDIQAKGSILARDFQNVATDMEELHASIATGARTAARTTDGYVRENAWGAIGVGAAVGVLLGFLLARR
jgi:ElaB/YqjD/DUF883 family membrane-anchored ribosome-binding protein